MFVFLFQEPVQVCNPFPKKKCQKVIKQIPKEGKVQECQRCYQTKKEIVTKKPKEYCEKVPRKACETKYRKKCRQEPKKKCQTVYLDHCKPEVKNVCREIKRHRCRQEPFQNCRTSYEKSCKYDEECHTNLELNCKRPQKTTTTTTTTTAPVYSTASSPVYRTRHRPYQHHRRRHRNRIRNRLYPSPRKKYNRSPPRFNKSPPVYRPQTHPIAHSNQVNHVYKYAPEVHPKYRRPISTELYEDYDEHADKDHFLTEDKILERLESSLLRERVTFKPTLKTTTTSTTSTTTTTTPNPLWATKFPPLTNNPTAEDYDPAIDSLGFSRRQLALESLDYGYVSENCAYKPNRQCRQVENCQEVPKAECEEDYREVCQDEPEEKCETTYAEKCEKVPKEECSTDYVVKCDEEPHEVCKTEYDKKCRTDYEEVKDYKTENHCYWPESKIKHEPCH